jgi:hypothetical protein
MKYDKILISILIAILMNCFCVSKFEKTFLYRQNTITNKMAIPIHSIYYSKTDYVTHENTWGRENISFDNFKNGDTVIILPDSSFTWKITYQSESESSPYDFVISFPTEEYRNDFRDTACVIANDSLYMSCVFDLDTTELRKLDSGMNVSYEYWLPNKTILRDTIIIQ